MRDRSSLFFAAIAMLSCCAKPGAGHAEDATVLQLAKPSDFQETYSATGQRSFKRSSSHVVVGLHVGRGAGRFRLDDLAIALPRSVPAKTFCVKLTSKDARYWSLNAYKGADGKTGLEKLETRSKFADDLAQKYKSDDFATRAIVSPDCTEDSDGPLVAVMPPGAVAEDVLVVYVNAVGSRAGMRLLDKDGKSLATGTCAPAARDSTIAFTEICEIPLAGLKTTASARLQTTLVGGDAGAPILSDVYLPGP